MTTLRNVAIVGFAQAPIVASDPHHITPEVLYPQVCAALKQCGVERDDIDYQTAGSADYFDGRPFGFVGALDVMGAWPPRQDSHLEMDAAFAAYYAWLRMQAGDCDTAMVVGYGSPSEGRPETVLNLTLDPYYQAPLGLGPLATSALQASAFMARSGAGDRDLAEIAARCRRAGADNPKAQVREAASAEELMKTDYAVAPLRHGYIPPVGESAVCLILAAEGKAEKMCKAPVWIHGVDQRAELQSIGARDLTRSAGTALAARKALAMAGLGAIADADLLETAAANPVEEMIVRESLGLPASGDAGIAVNPSGGPMVGNPLMMTGLIRMGEVFQRLSSGSAGECGVAHAAQGHCLQQNIVWVLGRNRRWT